MFPEVCCGAELEGTIRELKAFLKNESLFREPERFFKKRSVFKEAELS